MCGRYNFKPLKNKAFYQWLENYKLEEYSTDEVFPGSDILILTKVENKLVPDVRHWGKQIYQNQIINVRVETYKQKPTFSSMKRCIIPVTGFYEWDKSHLKHYIYKDEMMYLAGLYDDSSVIIMTGQSQNEMKNIHHRTPIIFTKKEMIQYLNGYLEPVATNNNLIYIKA